MHTEPLDDTSRRTLASLLLQQKKTTAAAAVIAGSEGTRERGSLDDTLRISAIAMAANANANAATSSGSLRMAQKSVFLAPWKVENWQGLAYVRCAMAAAVP